MSSEKPNYLGHRSRMREKFLINSSSVLDYEVLEMLFFAASPRRDTKIIAKNLLTKFGNITNIINADKHLLKDVAGVTDSIIVSIKLIKEIIVRESKDKISNKIIINNWQKMIEYCQTNIGNLKSERLHALFLNKKYQLISDKIYGGSESANTIHINKNVIIKDALNLSTSYVILCHNHPSGNTSPSKQDILTTKKIKDSLEDIAIKMLDHIIVAANGEYYSFQKESLI
ncbi:MAG: DNA repair protein RadC [Rickettsiales bacterium]|jgi:DNA repair protein RadC